MKKNKLKNSERKTAKKYFLRNETHEYLIEESEKLNITTSKLLQQIVDQYLQK